MRETQRKSFVLYLDSYIMIERLSDEQAGKLIKAIFEYKMDSPVRDFDNDPLLPMCFEMIKTYLDRDEIKYQERCQKNSENAKAGWENRKNKDNANANDSKRTHATEADSDTDNVSDNVSDNVNVTVTGKDTVTVTENDNMSHFQEEFAIPTFNEIAEHAYYEYKYELVDARKIAEEFIAYNEKSFWRKCKSKYENWQDAFHDFAERSNEFYEQSNGRCGV